MIALVAVAGFVMTGVAVYAGFEIERPVAGVGSAVVWAAATVGIVVSMRRAGKSGARVCVECGAPAGIRRGVGLWFCTDEHVEEWNDRHAY